MTDDRLMTTTYRYEIHNPNSKTLRKALALQGSRIKVRWKNEDVAFGQVCVTEITLTHLRVSLFGDRELIIGSCSQIGLLKVPKTHPIEYFLVTLSIGLLKEKGLPASSPTHAPVLSARSKHTHIRRRFHTR